MKIKSIASFTTDSIVRMEVRKSPTKKTCSFCQNAAQAIIKGHGVLCIPEFPRPGIKFYICLRCALGIAVSGLKALAAKK